MVLVSCGVIGELVVSVLSVSVRLMVLFRSPDFISLLLRPRSIDFFRLIVSLLCAC